MRTKEQKHENYRKTKEHPRKPMKKTLISKEQHTEIIENQRTHQRKNEGKTHENHGKTNHEKPKKELAF